MGLLTLTATIIDVVALYIAPNKENYRQYVYDHSPEFQYINQMKNENGGIVDHEKPKSE